MSIAIKPMRPPLRRMIVPTPELERAEPISIPSTPAFFDCQISIFEAALLCAGILITVSLHLTPVLNSSIAKGLVAILAFLCWGSSVSGFFFIAVSQILPFPEELDFSPGQVGFLVWPIAVLIWYRRLDLRGLTMLWPAIVYLLWLGVVTQQPLYEYDNKYMKALYYSVIACQLTNEARGRYLKCLLGLALGALMVMAGYWGNAVGLPIELSDWGGMREGYVRLGGVRADAVMVWPAVLVGVFGIIGIAITRICEAGLVRATWPEWLGAAAFVLSVPPIIATMTHGAYIGFGAMTIITAIVIALLVHNGRFNERAASRLARAACAISVLVLALFAANLLGVREKALSLWEYYTKETQSVVGSRESVWYTSLWTISHYPILGAGGAGIQEPIAVGYEQDEYYLSHNCFLDAGRASGVPGMLLFSWFFFAPAIKLWRKGDRVRYASFLLAHLAMFIFFMGLSFEGYKTFWGLWMLMAIVADRDWPSSVARTVHA